MKEIKNNAQIDAGTITFLSLFLLLLAFFILLNALSTIDETKTRKVLTSVAATFRSVVDTDTQAQILVSDLGPKLEAHEVLDALEQLWVTSVPITRVERLTGGQVMQLTIPVDELFLGGQPVLRADRDPLIDSTALVLARKSGTTLTEAQIVFGVKARPEMLSSTDSQLAAKRVGKVAAAVGDELKRVGYRGTPAVLGLADSQCRYLDPNIPEARRLELARRVDMVIYPTESES